ncbi:MAG TPA: TonB-dependent receptor [Opitutaceae bacterium]|nr:TonB-dependent receptor [Opitutaceae bacterium]
MNTHHPEMSGKKPRLGLVLGAAFSLVAAGSLLAQQAPAAAPAEEEAVKMGAFVVTGSNIPSTETTAEARTFPVATIDRRLIDQSGLLSTAELLQKMTLANGGSVPLTNNATGFTPGASSTSLRGLGPDATLVLVNGRRMPFYPVGTGGTTAFVDLNSIPLSAVERIEVLKDGASAVYGADAVAGVVNIIFRRGYNGAEASLSYGNTTNKDSSEFNANLLYGVSGDKGSIMVGVNYYNREPIFQRDRDYSAVPAFLSSNSSPPNFQLSRAAVLEALGLPAGSPLTINGAANTTTNVFFATTGPNLPNSLEPAPGNQNANNNGNLPASAYTLSTGRLSTFNFNETAGSYPEINRRGAFAMWERDVGALRLYGDMFFQQVHQIDELAPYATGNFETPGQTTIVIPSRTPNPILTASEVARGGRTAAAGAFNPFNPFNQDISGTSRIRLAEFGNRVFHNRNTAFSVTGGLRSEGIMDKWNLDAGVRYGQIENNLRAKLISTSRFLRILNAADPIFNPASPSYIGTTVPYNPFGYYRNPIASNSIPVDFATHYQRDENRSRLLQANFLLNTGSLFAMPAGDVGFAIGAEFRRESISQAPDNALQSGDILGTPASAITIAQRKIASYFAEAEVPILGGDRGVEYAHTLSLNLAARYEDFLTSNRNTFVPKVGLRWEPFADGSVVVRASWGRGFREPSLFELYAGRTAGLQSVTDPLTGTTESEQNVTTQGNRLLEAEDSESRNVGIVWSPKGALDGLAMSFDLWRLTREGTPAYDYQDTINRAVGFDLNGDPAPGGLRPGESVIRDLAGNVVQVNSLFLNSGETIAEGFDVSASYVFRTDTFGRFDVGATATYLGSYKFSTVPGVAPVEAVDDTIPGTEADDGYIRWKGQAYVDWTWKGFQSRVSANYTHSFDDVGGDANGNFYGELPFRIKAVTTIDAQVSYRLFPSTSAADRSWMSDLKLTVGCNNVFDEDPPFASDWGANSNGYPGFLYNNQGRFVYVGLDKKL